jgi:tetratricopeptide (TPR) repeat protein
MRPKPLQNLRSAARAALLAALVIVPLVMWTATADLFNLVKITTLWVLGIVAVALCAMWLAERRTWPRPQVAVAMGAFALALGLATLFANNQAVSLIGIYHRYNGLVPHLLYMAIALAVIGLYWDKPDDLRQVAVAIAVASSLIAVYVLVQKAGFTLIETTDVFTGKPSPFPDGTFGNSNFAGGFLGFSAPLFVFLGLSAASSRWRRAWFGLLAIDLLAVWFAQSRGGILAAALALLAMAVCYRELLPRWVRLGSLAAAGALVLVAVLVIWHPGTSRPVAPLDDVRALSTQTLGDRGNYWLAAANMFADNPLLGVGPDGYFENYPTYRTTSDANKLGLYETDAAHNIFFEDAANLGIVGILAYLSVAGLTLLYGYRSARRFTRNRRLLSTTLLAVFVGYLVQGFFSIDVPPLAVMGWVLIGAIAAMADPGVLAARERDKPAERGAVAAARPPKAKPGAKAGVRGRSGPRWLLHVPVAGVALVLIVVGTRPLIADVIARRAQEAAASGRSASAESGYLNAISWHPLEPAYRSFLAGYYASQANSASDPNQRRLLIEKALASHKKALELRPGNIYYLLNIAGLYQTWGEQIDPAKFAEADRWYRRALDHDPHNWEIHLRYGELFQAWANKVKDPAIQRRAVAQFQIAARTPDIKGVAAWNGLFKSWKSLGDLDQARAALDHAFKVDPKNEEAASLLKSLNAPPPAIAAPTPVPVPVPR